MTILINPCCTGIFDNPAPDVTQRVATARYSIGVDGMSPSPAANAAADRACILYVPLSPIDRCRYMTTFLNQSRMPLGYVIQCHGVVIRAQLRSLATLVSVTGRCRAQWNDLVMAHLRRFTRMDRPLILDVSSADGAQRGLLRSLVSTAESDCNATGAELVLVAAPEQRHILDLHHRTRSTSSVGEALQRITELIRTRRGRPVIAPYVG